MPKPIRVAHLTPAYFSPQSYIGGGERYVHYVAEALRTVGGVEQCIFALGAEDGLFEQGGIPIRVLRNESTLLGDPNAYSAALWRELPGFDLVHLHQSLTLFGAYSIAIVRSLGIPSVGTDLGGGENALMVSGRCIELLDGIISISSYAHSLIDKLYSRSHEILIGPVDTERFSPVAAAARDRRMILCVSRIMPHKGIDRVIAALPSGLRLTIVGRVYHEPYYEMLREMAARKEVVFVENADDDKLRDLYCSSGLFVQASTVRDIYGNTVAKPELMGLTTLEAMSCGLPVAVSTTGSLPELVADPRFGRVFSDEQQLIAILRDVLDSKWPPPDAGSLARAHTVGEHGMEIIGKRLAAFYRAILATHQSSLQ
jgi:glycosyltransferase involved in cell wall biosynthesis